MRGNNNCAVQVVSCVAKPETASGSGIAIYEDLQTYGLDPSPRPEPPPGHELFPNHVQPVIAAIGVVRSFETPIDMDGCFKGSRILVEIERAVVGEPAASFSMQSRGAAQTNEYGEASLPTGFPAYDYRYFPVGDRIIFAAATFEEPRKSVTYDPTGGAYQVQWAELLVAPADDLEERIEELVEYYGQW